MGMHVVVPNTASGAIVTSFDETRNIVFIRAYGNWTIAQVDRSFDELADIRSSRAKRNGLRVFVDRRDTVVQQADVAERLSVCTRTCYGPEDRVAVLVDTSLAKLQLRRVLDERTHKLFVSESAAMVWLQALDH